MHTHYGLSQLTQHNEAELKAAIDWLDNEFNGTEGSNDEKRQGGKALACYLVSLVFLSHQHQQTAPSPSSIGEARKVYVSRIGDAARAACDLLPSSEQLPEYLTRMFRQTNDELLAALHHQQIHAHSSEHGPDIERMKTDEVYRAERFQVMARNTPLHPSGFSTLLSLARSMQYPIYKVYLTDCNRAILLTPLLVF